MDKIKLTIDNPFVHYVPHIKHITDISPYADMIQYRSKFFDNCFAICPSGKLKDGDGALIFQHTSFLHKNNDKRFEFARTYAFDIALPLSMFPEVTDFFVETFCNIEDQDLFGIVFPK